MKLLAIFAVLLLCVSAIVADNSTAPANATVGAAAPLAAPVAPKPPCDKAPCDKPPCDKKPHGPHGAGKVIGKIRETLGL